METVAHARQKIEWLSTEYEKSLLAVKASAGPAEQQTLIYDELLKEYTRYANIKMAPKILKERL